jgi:hypothetical protein
LLWHCPQYPSGPVIRAHFHYRPSRRLRQTLSFDSHRLAVNVPAPLVAKREHPPNPSPLGQFTMLHDILCVILDPRLGFHAPPMRPAGKSASPHVRLRNSEIPPGCTSAPPLAQTDPPHRQKGACKMRETQKCGRGWWDNRLHVISNGMGGTNEQMNEERSTIEDRRSPTSSRSRERVRNGNGVEWKPRVNEWEKAKGDIDNECED